LVFLPPFLLLSKISDNFTFFVQNFWQFYIFCPKFLSILYFLSKIPDNFAFFIQNFKSFWSTNEKFEIFLLAQILLTISKNSHFQTRKSRNPFSSFVQKSHISPICFTFSKRNTNRKRSRRLLELHEQKYSANESRLFIGFGRRCPTF
jgi:hypothetical protein